MALRRSVEGPEARIDPRLLRLETDRLILRLFREEDFEPYARMMADPEVTRFLGTGEPLDRAAAWRSLAVFLGHWSLRGYGMWAVEEKASGLLAGRVGAYNPEGWPGFEIGWALAREHWGKGYATEASRRALDAAFGVLGRERVISLIVPGNRDSIRVAERLGEEPEGEAELSGRKVLVYGLFRERWERLAADGAPEPPHRTRRNG